MMLMTEVEKGGPRARDAGSRPGVRGSDYEDHEARVELRGCVYGDGQSWRARCHAVPVPRTATSASEPLDLTTENRHRRSLESENVWVSLQLAVTSRAAPECRQVPRV